MEAVRSGPRALEFLSEPLVLDYLSQKFNRTLPRWSSQKPFELNINQMFYSYAHQARVEGIEQNESSEEAQGSEGRRLQNKAWSQQLLL